MQNTTCFRLFAFFIFIFTAFGFNAQQLKECCKINSQTVDHYLSVTTPYAVRKDTLIYSSKKGFLDFYIRRDTIWELVDQMEVSPETGSISSISWFENTIAIGDSRGNGKSHLVYEGKGAVYIYHRSKGKWNLQEKISSPTGEIDRFGSSVQLTDRFLMVSAPQITDCTEKTRSDCTTNMVTRDYIYELKDGKWKYKDEFPYEKAFYNFGHPVFTSDNGILMGKDGKIYHFSYNEKSKKWIAGDTLDHKNEQLFAADFTDNYIIASNGNDLEKLLVYSKDAIGKWNYLQTITEENPRSMDTEFGESVDLTDEYIAIGAPSSRTAWGYQGFVNIYKLGKDGKFEKTQRIMASDGEKGDSFGKRVLWSGNGLIVVANNDFVRKRRADNEGRTLTYRGDIYFFEMTEDPPDAKH